MAEEATSTEREEGIYTDYDRQFALATEPIGSANGWDYRQDVTTGEVLRRRSGEVGSLSSGWRFESTRAGWESYGRKLSGLDDPPPAPTPAFGFQGLEVDEAARLQGQAAREYLTTIEPESEPPPPTVADYAVFLEKPDGDGIVADEQLARESPCIAYEVGQRKLTYSKGVVGALTAEQTALYCTDTEVRPLSEAQKERLEAFRESAETCHLQVEQLPKGERLSPLLACMSKELEKRGQKL